MIRLRLILSVMGYLGHGFVFLMAIPLLIACLLQEAKSIFVFALTIIICLLISKILMGKNENINFDDLNRMESMGVVTFGWLLLTLLGAIPYIFFGLSPIDSFFESMSGFTTTGSTILTDFNMLNDSMYFYRGYSQWIGGLGILVVFVALLPQLAIAGRQLFFAEVSGESKEKISPRIKDTALKLLALYFILTLFCTMALCYAGMDPVDAASNAFSTMAAAGFSPNARSIMGYNSPAVEWVLIIFMFLAGANFVLQVKSLGIFTKYINSLHTKNKIKKKTIHFLDSFKCFAGNSEIIVYTLIILVSAAAISILLSFHMPTTPLSDIIRQAFYQCLSIITTTGSASIDYDLQWSMAAKTILVILMFVGGCSGSAGGGMKVVRIMILAKYFWKMLLKNIYPESVICIKFDNRILRENEVQPVLTFFMFYLFLFFFGGTLLSLLEDDMVLGYTGAIACLGNIGPGFGSIGPMGNFAAVSTAGKSILIFLMWAGRLEVMTLVVFLRPEIWRNARWR